MTPHLKSINALAEVAVDVPVRGLRRVIALAGPPGSGKTTLADRLSRKISDFGSPSCVIPMDGFHLSNPELVERGLLDRKGAPETFDVAGLIRLVSTLHDTAELSFPTFDRARDITIPDGGHLGAGIESVVIEGNYLLYDAAGWRDLSPHWDLSVRLEVPQDVLRQRLIDRWLTHGLSPEKAEQRAESNDLRNARAVTETALVPDAIISNF